MTAAARRRAILALVAVASALVAIGLWALSRDRSGADEVRPVGFGEIGVRVDPGDGRAVLKWCLLAALDTAQHARGLMEVTDLGDYPGMAFVYEQDLDNEFYMRNTPTPLSIAWIAADGRVVSMADMAPCGDRDDCPLYPPGGSYRYAIETFQGDLAELGITEDATVTVGGACPAR